MAFTSTIVLRRIRVLLAGFIGLAAVSSLTISTAVAESSLYEIRGCNSRIRALCQGQECTCKRWFVEWRTPDGRVWGISEGKTHESVQRQRDRDIAFERRYAAFFMQPMDPNYENASGPICDACFPQEPMNPTDGAIAAMGTATLLYDEWARKGEEALPAMLRAVFLPNTTIDNSPFRSTGFGLMDYANALRDVIRKQKRMRQDLLYTERERGRLYGSLEGSIRELKAAGIAADATYRKLPASIRDTLEGKGAAAKNQSGSTGPSVQAVAHASGADRHNAKIEGGKVVIDETVNGEVSNYEVSISDLNLKSTRFVEDGTSVLVSIQTKGTPSVSWRTKPCWASTAGCEGVSGDIFISCSSRSECDMFVNGIRNAAGR